MLLHTHIQPIWFSPPRTVTRSIQTDIIAIHRVRSPRYGHIEQTTTTTIDIKFVWCTVDTRPQGTRATHEQQQRKWEKRQKPIDFWHFHIRRHRTNELQCEIDKYGKRMTFATIESPLCNDMRMWLMKGSLSILIFFAGDETDFLAQFSQWKTYDVRKNYAKFMLSMPIVWPKRM